MILKMFTFIGLIVFSSLAFTSEDKNCGNYDGNYYGVTTSNSNLPSKKKRKNEARTIFSEIKLYNSQVKRCDIYKSKKSLLSAIFDEVERNYIRAAGDGNKHHYKCLKEIYKKYVITGYLAVQDFEMDPSYKEISPKVKYLFLNLHLNN